MTEHNTQATRAIPKRKIWHVVAIAVMVCLVIVLIRLDNSAIDAPASNVQADAAETASDEAIDKGSAASACMDAITPMLNQPRSADFHTFTDTTFHTDGTRARFTVGLTAKNGFGLPIDATAACIFDGSTLTSAELLPAGS